MKVVLMFMILVGVIVGCSGNRTMTLSESAYLSVDQIAAHEKSALSGNRNSIFKLINYYQYSDFQPEKNAYWHEVNAGFGSMDSKYKVGIMYALGGNGYTVTKFSCAKGLVLLNECQLVDYKDSRQLYENAKKNCE